MAEVEQALVAIGGRATRLHGVDVPVSKALLAGHDGRPFVYWCLRSLEEIGIRRVLLAAHTDEQERAGWEMYSGSSWRFEKVEIFRDAGLGVHGIPHQAMDRLDDVVLFEAGQSVLHPDHYRRLVLARRPDAVVASAFRPRADNPRFTTVVEGRCCVSHGAGTRWALAHPMIIDRSYVRALPEHGFTVERILASYRARGALRAVRAVLPVEFDVATEYRRAVRIHADNARDCRHGVPWQADPTTDAFAVTVENREGL